ncbi:hypothetical protein V8H18_04710 [Lautropia mirabilis]
MYRSKILWSLAGLFSTPLAAFFFIPLLLSRIDNERFGMIARPGRCSATPRPWTSASAAPPPSTCPPCAARRPSPDPAGHRRGLAPVHHL